MPCGGHSESRCQYSRRARTGPPVAMGIYRHAGTDRPQAKLPLAPPLLGAATRKKLDEEARKITRPEHRGHARPHAGCVSWQTPGSKTEARRHRPRGRGSRSTAGKRADADVTGRAGLGARLRTGVPLRAALTARAATPLRVPEHGRSAQRAGRDLRLSGSAAISRSSATATGDRRLRMRCRRTLRRR